MNWRGDAALAKLRSEPLPPHAMAANDPGPTGRHRPSYSRSCRQQRHVVPRRGFLQVASFRWTTRGPDRKQSGRLEMARWITSPQNPLTGVFLC